MANHSVAPVVVMTKHYTSGPPSGALVLKGDDDGGGGGGDVVDTLAIGKQEEWIKKRKVEQITTKQIETRVKRQVVVDEDGQVVDDSGPQVTTNTSEDTQTKREEHTEKKGGDGAAADGGADAGASTATPPEGWVAVPGAVIVREKHEKKSNTRDEINERLETEQVHHLGQITNEELQEALETQRETGQALAYTLHNKRSASSSGDSARSVDRRLASSSSLPYSSPVKILHQSRKHKRTVDQQNTEERSEEKDGRITTETTKHEHHEEVDDEELPDDERPPSDTSSAHEVVKETRNHYTTLKDEDQVEYVAVPKGGDLSSGIKLGRGVKSANLRTVEYVGDADIHPATLIPPTTAAQPTGAPSPEPYDPPKAQDPRAEKLQNATPPTTQQPEAVAPVAPPAERTDALTKKPLDLEEEEETRKLETSRWLENHFGSESSSRSGSTGGSSSHGRKSQKKKADKMPSHVSSGGISVTMVSDPVVRSHHHQHHHQQQQQQQQQQQRYEAPDFPAPAPPGGSKKRFVGGVMSQPLGPEQIYGVASPPQSPVFKSLPASFANQINGAKTVAEVGYQQQQRSNAADVKRTASFNHASASSTNAYSWMNKEELKGHGSVSAARQSFLSSMNAPEKATTAEPVTYSAPIAKRWPPPKQIDEDDQVRTSTPVYSHHQPPPQQGKGGSTIIRLGPSVEYSTPIRKTSGSGISRTQSLMTPTNPRVVANPYQHNNNHSSNNNMSTSRMNLLNSSLQSVPERERQHKGFFVDVERSFAGQKMYQQKSPPPRPAPPSMSSGHYGAPSINSSGFVSSSTPLRAAESFRIVRSPPMFSDDSPDPPVRPVRRKSKRAPKTDSGTQCNPQTIRNDIAQQQSFHTLERSKPLKQYYLGEDPFSAQKPVANGVIKKDVVDTRPLFDQERPARKTEITRSQTLPRRPSKPDTATSAFTSASPVSTNVKTLNSSVANLTSSRVFSDQDRSLNETGGSAYGQPKTRIVPIATETAKENKPVSSKVTSLGVSKTASLSTAAVNRSQSFSVENQKAKIALVHSTPLRSVSIRAANSPLYKSTSFLNRANEHQSTFGALKSPGIVTSISKSQLDLNKSTNDLTQTGFQAQPNSALYTLPRKRTVVPKPATTPVDIGPVLAAGKVQPGISERLAQLSSPNANADDDPADPAAPSNETATSPPVTAPTSPVTPAAPVSPVTANPATPTSPISPISPISPGTRGESYSSLHRRRLQQQKEQQKEAAQVVAAAPEPDTLSAPVAPVQSVTPPPPPLPQETSTPVFQTSTKATHRSFRAPSSGARETIHEESESSAAADRPTADKPELNELAPEARSFKDRIALLESAGIHYANPAQTLPRVVAGKVKVPPPPPPKTSRLDGAKVADDPESGEKRQKFLEGLLSTAPELFMHIHGNENLKEVSRDDVIDGKTNRLPRTPSPPTPASGVNKVYTSTPAFKPAATSESVMPLTPPPMLIRQSSGSPFGSQRDLAIRRGSLNSSTNSSSAAAAAANVIPAVKIPAPVNYTETVRVRSNNDPDSQSDSVQSYSKKVQPFVDGFSSETTSSSLQTSVTRSEYTTNALRSQDDLPAAYHAIRPQQSGGVIIQVRGNGH